MLWASDGRVWGRLCDNLDIARAMVLLRVWTPASAPIWCGVLLDAPRYFFGSGVGGGAFTYVATEVEGGSPGNVLLTVALIVVPPAGRLIAYSLTTPGVGTLVVGTGHIDSDSKNCQLEQNLIAAQIKPNGLSLSDRRAVEKTTAAIQDGKTNYFQLPYQDLTPPRELALRQDSAAGTRIVTLTWQTAFAGDESISHYEILRDGQKIGDVKYRPQVAKTPLLYEDREAGAGAHKYLVVTVDAIGRRAETGEVMAPV